jgi:holo-[acyl-carrier protein] synthase
MITGVGIDTVHVKRMERWQADSKLKERYFREEELEYVSSRAGSSTQSLAARFAAKEAFGKALGTGLSGIALKDITVVNRKNGSPELKVYGTALLAFEKSGANRAHISLSHDNDNAIAMVVLEKA